MNKNIFFTIFYLIALVKSIDNLTPCKPEGAQAEKYSCYYEMGLALVNNRFDWFAIQLKTPPETKEFMKVKDVTDSESKKIAIHGNTIHKKLNHIHISQLIDTEIKEKINKGIKTEVMIEIIEHFNSKIVRVGILNNLEIYEDKKNVLKIFIGLIEALQYLEEKNYIYSGLSTEVIGINDSAEVKIIDFEFVEKKEDLIDSNLINSNLAYELRDPVLFNETYKLFPYDESVGVYGLGLTLYQIKHGNLLPFEHEDEKNKFVDNLENGEYLTWKNVDVDFIFLILNCLRFDKTERMSLKRLKEYAKLALNRNQTLFFAENVTLSNKLWLNSNKFLNLIEDHQKQYPEDAEDALLLANIKNGIIPDSERKPSISKFWIIIIICVGLGLILILVYLWCKKGGSLAEESKEPEKKNQLQLSKTNNNNEELENKKDEFEVNVEKPLV